MWQAEADTELTLSASPATAVGQSKLYPGESRLEYGSRLFTLDFDQWSVTRPGQPLLRRPTKFGTRQIGLPRKCRAESSNSKKQCLPLIPPL